MVWELKPARVPVEVIPELEDEIRKRRQSILAREMVKEIRKHKLIDREVAVMSKVEIDRKRPKMVFVTLKKSEIERLAKSPLIFPVPSPCLMQTTSPSSKMLLKIKESFKSNLLSALTLLKSFELHLTACLLRLVHRWWLQTVFPSFQTSLKPSGWS